MAGARAGDSVGRVSDPFELDPERQRLSFGAVVHDIEHPDDAGGAAPQPSAESEAPGSKAAG